MRDWQGIETGTSRLGLRPGAGAFWVLTSSPLRQELVRALNQRSIGQTAPLPLEGHRLGVRNAVNTSREMAAVDSAGTTGAERQRRPSRLWGLSSGLPRLVRSCPQARWANPSRKAGLGG
jgi:hypothetical protein